MQQPVNAPISSPFGPRRNRFHSGIDYEVPAGAEVKASESGTVVRASYHPDYGNVIVIDRGVINSVRTYTLYAHLADDSMTVQPGQPVSVGEIIGAVGNTGRTYGKNGGYHLHYEIIGS